MAEREGPEQPRRYCRNCGVEVRAGNAFCVSCGERLAPAGEALRAPVSGSTTAVPAPPRDTSGGASQWGGLRHFTRRLSALPTPLKAVAGAVALVVLILLGPALCAALLGVSLIALVVRMVQRKAGPRWYMATGASLVLLLASGGFWSVYGAEPSRVVSDEPSGVAGVTDSSREVEGSGATFDATPEIREECGIQGCPGDPGYGEDYSEVEFEGVDAYTDDLAVYYEVRTNAVGRRQLDYVLRSVALEDPYTPVLVVKMYDRGGSGLATGWVFRDGQGKATSAGVREDINFDPLCALARYC